MWEYLKFYQRRFVREHPEYKIEKIERIEKAAFIANDDGDQPSQKRRRVTAPQVKVIIQPGGQVVGIPAFWEAADSWLASLTRKCGTAVNVKEWQEYGFLNSDS